MSSTYKPLFNDQRGGNGDVGGPMALAPPRSTGRLSDRGKMDTYRGPNNYNYNGPYDYPDMTTRTATSAATARTSNPAPSSLCLPAAVISTLRT